MKKKNGFTLVEIIITIALLGIIGTVIAVNMVGLYKKQDDKEDKRTRSIIKAAAQAYMENENKTGECVDVQTLIDENYLKDIDEEKYKDYKVGLDGQDFPIDKNCEATIETKDYNITYYVDIDNNGRYADNEHQSFSFKAGQTASIETLDSLGITGITGRNFRGWGTSTSTKTVSYTGGNSVEVTKNISLYAIFSTETYHLSYYEEDKTTLIQELSITSKQVEIANINHEKTGYTFDGWRDVDNDDTYAVGSKIDISKDLALYAKWSKTPYTLTLDANGGSLSPNTKTIYYEDNYNLPTPTRTGYEFLGWFTEQTDGQKVNNGNKIERAENHTLYAHWKAKTFKVTFDNNDGTNTKSTKNVTYDDKYGDLPTLSRDGYKFLGWYTTQTGGDKIESDSKVNITKDTTFYAHWEILAYTVTFEAGNGQASESSIKVKYNEAIGTLPTATLTGYSFQGWYTKQSGGEKINKNWKITQDVTFYAHYVDDIAPECGSVTGASTTWRGIGPNNEAPKIVQECKDSGSGCEKQYYVESFLGKQVVKTRSITIKDNAGNTKTCPAINVYYDGVPPTCGKTTGESTTWTNENRQFSVACTDEGSGCTASKYSFTAEDVLTELTKDGVIYMGVQSVENVVVIDKVGNKGVCPAMDIYYDPYPPKASIITEIKKAEAKEGETQEEKERRENVNVAESTVTCYLDNKPAAGETKKPITYPEDGHDVYCVVDVKTYDTTKGSHYMYSYTTGAGSGGPAGGAPYSHWYYRYKEKSSDPWAGNGSWFCSLKDSTTCSLYSHCTNCLEIPETVSNVESRTVDAAGNMSENKLIIEFLANGKEK